MVLIGAFSRNAKNDLPPFDIQTVIHTDGTVPGRVQCGSEGPIKSQDSNIWQRQVGLRSTRTNVVVIKYIQIRTLSK